MNLYLLIFLTILCPTAIISDHLTLTLTKSIGDVGESTKRVWEFVHHFSLSFKTNYTCLQTLRTK